MIFAYLTEKDKNNLNNINSDYSLSLDLIRYFKTSNSEKSKKENHQIQGKIIHSFSHNDNNHDVIFDLNYIKSVLMKNKVLWVTSNRLNFLFYYVDDDFDLKNHLSITEGINFENILDFKNQYFNIIKVKNYMKNLSIFCEIHEHLSFLELLNLPWNDEVCIWDCVLVNLNLISKKKF